MSIRSDLSIRTVALGTSRKNLRTLNQNLHLRRPYRYSNVINTGTGFERFIIYQSPEF